MAPNSNDGDDLDLLLSLQDKVPETPPSSPSAGYLSDEDVLRKPRGQGGDMSVFRDAVQDCIGDDVEAARQALKSKGKMKKGSHEDSDQVEKFSGLRIRSQVVSPVELSNRIADIRFVRLQAIKNLLRGDTFSGCWATIGVLMEKGNQKTSSTGKPYAIWKIGCLDEKTTSVFLFGDAYKMNNKELPGTVFALFSCSVRKDSSENGFSLSVFSSSNMLKIGTSSDYGVCKGKKKDGMDCTIAVNKRRGIYCSYHRQKTSEKYTVKRNEFFGGNLRTAFKEPSNSEGIYMVNPVSNQRKESKSTAPMKILSVDALKKALSNAGKVTTNVYSQGIRFLTEVTGKSDTKELASDKSSRVPKPTRKELDRGKSIKEPDAKRMKVAGHAAAEKTSASEKMIELEFISSDEEC